MAFLNVLDGVRNGVMGNDGFASKACSEAWRFSVEGVGYALSFHTVDWRLAHTS